MNCTNKKDRLAAVLPKSANGQGANSNLVKLGSQLKSAPCNRVLPRSFALVPRRALQRFIGDFVSEHLFFRPVASDSDGVTHSSDPSVGQLPNKGPCIFIIVIIEGAA